MLDAASHGLEQLRLLQGQQLVETLERGLQSRQVALLSIQQGQRPERQFSTGMGQGGLGLEGRHVAFMGQQGQQHLRLGLQFDQPVAAVLRTRRPQIALDNTQQRPLQQLHPAIGADQLGHLPAQHTELLRAQLLECRHGQIHQAQTLPCRQLEQ